MWYRVFVVKGVGRRCQIQDRWPDARTRDRRQKTEDRRQVFFVLGWEVALVSDSWLRGLRYSISAETPMGDHSARSILLIFVGIRPHENNNTLSRFSARPGTRLASGQERRERVLELSLLQWNARAGG